jgi:hypothetical protein
MSKHETEMHRDRRELIAALRAILRAFEQTGPNARTEYLATLANAAKLLERFPQEPCDDGLFGDHRQMDLADRRDLK